MSNQPGPQYPVVEGSKISGDPIVKVQESGLNDCNATESPITQMNTSGLDNRRATEEIALLDHKTEPSPEDKERKIKSGYKNSLKFLEKMNKCDPKSLTPRDKALMRKHAYCVRKYEKRISSGNPPPSIDDSTVGKHDSAEKRTPVIIGSSDFKPPAVAMTDLAKPSKNNQSVLPTCSEPSTSKANLMNKIKENKPTNSKRQHPNDKHTSEKKRQKGSINLNSPLEFQVAIIDRGQPDGKIEADKWLIIEEKLMRAILEEIKNAPSKEKGMFAGAKWSKGVKVVGCSNKESYEFLTSFIQNLGEIWPGAKLDVVSIADIPHGKTLRVWVPPPLMEDSTTLSLIKCQNEEMLTDNWTIVRGRERDNGNGNGKDLWINVSNASLQILKRSQGLLKFGIGHIRMIIPEEGRGRGKNDTGVS